MTNHWMSIAIVIEAMSILAWIAGALTQRIKYAFLFGFNVMAPVAWLHLLAGHAANWRDVAAMASVLIYLVNMNVVILAWSRDTAMAKLDNTLRRTEKFWLTLLMANAAGWLYCLPFLFVAERSGPANVWDVAGAAVFTAGIVIHVVADAHKRRFKSDPGNRGRILDRGLWRLSRHPNYFGDLLVYVGWALFAANLYAWVSPALNLIQYLFDAIPKNERWAAEHYGEAWRTYAERTNRLTLWRPGPFRTISDPRL